MQIDKEELRKMKDLQNIEYDDEMSLNYVQDKLKEAHQNWQEMKEKGIEFQEKELIDLYPNKLSKEALNDKKQRKKVLRSVLKAKQKSRHITI